MIIRNLDSSGDWTFGHGRQDYLRDDRAIALNIRTRLLSFRNDCFWFLTFGVDWWNLLGSRNPNAEIAIILQTREVLANSYGVVRINEIVPVFDVRTRRLSIAYDADTIYTRNLRNSVVIDP